MEKICKHCEKSKPLTIEFWLPRKEAKDGFRGTCRVCWYAQQRPNKRRHYTNHADRLKAERKTSRAANPEKSKLKDLRYYLTHSEERIAKSRAYYRKNADRLVADAINRRRRKQSFDYGWTKALPHDHIELKLWKDRTYAELCRREAQEFLEHLEICLLPNQCMALDALLDANFDICLAAEIMQVSTYDFNQIMGAIKESAVALKKTEASFWR